MGSDAKEHEEESRGGLKLEPLLLKVPEVAGLLKLSRSAVYALMDRGALPYVKIGSARRVELAAVHKLIEAGRVGPASP